jgi:hypothetical protein
MQIGKYQITIIDKEEEFRATLSENGKTLEFFTIKGNHPLNQVGVSNETVALALIEIFEKSKEAGKPLSPRRTNL